MHAAFLMNRTIAVKLGTTISKPKKVTGGAVQGSVLGVLDHNVVLNDFDDSIDDEIYIAKYIDDMTMIDPIPVSTPHTIDTSGNRNTHLLTPHRSEKAFNTISKR